jgi:hypothetical protein
VSEDQFARNFPLCVKLGLYGTAGDMEAVWASDVERLLRDAPVAYGFGSPGGSFTISSDLKGPGSAELAGRVVMLEQLEKPETAADLLKEIVAIQGNLKKDPTLRHGEMMGLKPEFLERCKRALGL